MQDGVSGITSSSLYAAYCRLRKQALLWPFLL